MDVEARVAQAMRQLESNIEKASRNPDAVLQGSFSATSGNVTVWVDALGRTERFRVAPDSVLEGDESRLVEALNEATKEARRKAENLEFEEQEGHQEHAAGQRRNRRRLSEEAHTGEVPESWLR